MINCPPVLILAWRRPQTLRQVINALRPIAPKRLFVACDGPNLDRPDEADKVAATRLLIEQDIDWPCEIERFYSDVNQGCRLGVSRAITWFFEQVDAGIILEDDCVPHPDFFVFSATLLERYRYDMRVWCISGNNFQDGLWNGHGDYFFSQIPMCWGWASWRSRWQHYDSDLSLWPFSKHLNLLASLFPDPVMRSYWFHIWQKLWSQGNPDSWAYRWAFTCVVNRGLTALPKVNLVSNIGFGDDATHTLHTSLVRTTFALKSNSLVHPLFVCSHFSNDLSIFNNHFGGKWRRFPLLLVRWLRVMIRVFSRLLNSALRRAA